MRTKTLLATAALGSAIMASAAAQVYSVNAVGYVNLVIPPGFSLIANPLDAGEGMNTLGNLFEAAPLGTVVYDFGDDGIYNVQTKFPNWANPDLPIPPGRGIFIRNQTNPAEPFTITFVGEVMQGDLSNPIPQGLSIRSSMVPQAGKISTDLGFPAENGDVVYKFDNASGVYSIKTKFPDPIGWAPGSVEPELGVGESVFLSSGSAKSWDRTFSVNQ
jgi:hypothetical protein